MYIFRTLLWGTILIIAVLVAGPMLALSFDQSFPVISLSWGYYLGAALAASGLVLAIIAGLYLVVPGLARAAPFEAGGAFSVAGPYAYVRNPFMLAVIMMLWGEALLLSRLSLVLYAFFSTWILHAWVVFFEEPALRAKLGRMYLTYHAQIPRWFPRLRSYSVKRNT